MSSVRVRCGTVSALSALSETQMGFGTFSGEIGIIDVRAGHVVATAGERKEQSGDKYTVKKRKRKTDIIYSAHTVSTSTENGTENKTESLDYSSLGTTDFDFTNKYCYYFTITAFNLSQYNKFLLLLFLRNKSGTKHFNSVSFKQRNNTAVIFKNKKYIYICFKKIRCTSGIENSSKL